MSEKQKVDANDNKQTNKQTSKQTNKQNKHNKRKRKQISQTETLSPRGMFAYLLTPG